MSYRRSACLTKAELRRFLEIEIENGSIYDDERELNLILEAWRNYDLEVICLATSLSELLESRLKRSIDVHEVLNKVIQLPEERGLELVIEVISEDFIAYLLRHHRQEDSTIEEDLLELRRRYAEHEYPA